MGLFNNDKDLMKQFEELCLRQQLQIDELNRQLSESYTKCNELDESLYKSSTKIANLTNELNITRQELVQARQELETEKKDIIAIDDIDFSEPVEQSSIEKKCSDLIDENKKLQDRCNILAKRCSEHIGLNNKLQDSESLLQNEVIRQRIQYLQLKDNYKELLEASAVLLDFYNKHKNKKGKQTNNDEVLQESINELKEKLEKMESNLNNMQSTSNVNENIDNKQVDCQINNDSIQSNDNVIDELNDDGHNKFMEKLKEIYGGH